MGEQRRLRTAWRQARLRVPAGGVFDERSTELSGRPRCHQQQLGGLQHYGRGKGDISYPFEVVSCAIVIVVKIYLDHGGVLICLGNRAGSWCKLSFLLCISNMMRSQQYQERAPFRHYSLDYCCIINLIRIHPGNLEYNFNHFFVEIARRLVESCVSVWSEPM